MHLIKHSFILLVTVLISQWAFSQEDAVPKKISTFYTYDEISVTGEVLSEDALTTEVLLFTGDTITIKNSDIDRREDLKDLFHYPKNRFHYKDGFHIDLNLGSGTSGAGGHSYSDFSINKRFTPKLTLGVGIGSQQINSSFRISTGLRDSQANIWSSNRPVFVQGKYYLNRKRRSLYIHSRVGYTIAKDSRILNAISKNGFITSYGIGFTKATKGFVKTFVQFTQTHNYTAGSATNINLNGPITFDYKLWMNRIGISFGFEFNLSSKCKKFKYN